MRFLGRCNVLGIWTFSSYVWWKFRRRLMQKWSVNEIDLFYFGSSLRKLFKMRLSVAPLNPVAMIPPWRMRPQKTVVTCVLAAATVGWKYWAALYCLSCFVLAVFSLPVCCNSFQTKVRQNNQSEKNLVCVLVKLDLPDGSCKGINLPADWGKSSI